MATRIWHRRTGIPCKHTSEIKFFAPINPHHLSNSASPHADHENINYLHAYISFSYQKGRPYLSVYLQSFETGDWPIGKLNLPFYYDDIDL